MKRYTTCLSAAIALVLVAACGGGGDSSSDGGRPSVSLAAEPTELDTGDRVFLTLRINNVSDPGVEVKVRYPRQLTYVEDSSQLTVDEASVPLSVDVDTAAAHSEDRFLVFYLSPVVFENGDGEGEISIALHASEAVDEAEIAVDADVADFSFDAEEPEFTAQDSILISVLDEN